MARTGHKAGSGVRSWNSVWFLTPFFWFSRQMVQPVAVWSVARAASRSMGPLSFKRTISHFRRGIVRFLRFRFVVGVYSPTRRRKK